MARIECLLLFVLLAHSTESVENDNELKGTSKYSSTSDDHKNVERHNYANFSQEFLKCKKAEITYQNVQLLENQTIFIPEYASHPGKGLYRPGDYYLSQNAVFVCVLPTSKEEPKLISEEVLTYLIVIGILISHTFLLLHFIAFLLVPEMKNLPGKNLASLTVSTFLINMIYLIGRLLHIEANSSCYYLALAAYYFTMTSIFWMNAIAFDLFRTLRQATTKLRLTSKRAELKRFIMYSLHSWVTPAVFLIVMVVGKKTDLFPKYLTPDFDSYPRCWFTHLGAAMVFFVGPLGVLLLLNATFFLFSAFIIFSNSMKAKNEASGWIKKFSIYGKLSVVMGMGWTTKLTTYFFQTTPLIVISIVITTLQGVFIFIAFTRFRKIQTSILQRYRRFRKSIASFSTFQTETLRSNVNNFNIFIVSSRKSSETTTE